MIGSMSSAVNPTFHELPSLTTKGFPVDQNKGRMFDEERPSPGFAS